MNVLNSIIRFFIYSNLFVSFCTTAFTHLTYLVYDLPTENLAFVLLMIFSFTFFTYNGQRLFRLRKKTIQANNVGNHLKWVIQNKNVLSISSSIFLLIGLCCSYFISLYSWAILIPMGLISVFYVVPFHPNNQTLRTLPYLKIIFIALVWSLIIVGLPFIDSGSFFHDTSLTDIAIALTQTLFFVIAITIPFDIRDLNFDKRIHLKTIPSLIGIKTSILLSEVLLCVSVLLLFFSIKNETHFYALLIGHIITMIIISFTNKKRKELFFAGLIESSPIILYCCVLITRYFSL